MLPVTWDSVLIGVSLLVAFIASFTALDSAGRVAVSRGWRARCWLTGGGIAMGIGIWSMHFVGMLAMKMPMIMYYDPTLTVLSLLVAIVAAILAIAQVMGGGKFTPRRWLCASAILSAGVVTMHYTGMNALLISPAPHWNFFLVISSIAIAFAASAAALWLAFHLRRGEKKLMLMRALASVVMGIAVAGMHYIGMAAAVFHPGSVMMHHGISEQGLAAGVTIVTLAILSATLLVSMLDAQLHAARLASKLKQANHELSQLALYDPLTSLPNRVLLELQLDASIKRAQPFTLMYMDLDGFKAVNDTWGHYIGDRLLIAVTERLRGQLDNEMLLARLGGDEFVLMVQKNDSSGAIALAQQLVHSIDAAFRLDRCSLRVSLSVGITFFPQHGLTRQELMFNADSAMYHTKHSGRNGWCLFEPAMSATAQHHLALANDLWNALDRQEMLLHYQPKFRACGHELIGFEALLRWQHPTRGLLMPELFLPRAEKTGQIVALGSWVIDEACRQLRVWHDEGHKHWSVSVNLSALQFHQRELLDTVKEILRHYHLPPGSLTLEITENLAMRDPQFSQRCINELQKAGVNVAIDNFGIGCANLLQLKHLEASELKIDRSFINTLRADSEDVTVMSAMLALAQSLNLHMVAEGVETEEQQQLLSALGFDAMQGYLLGKPTSADRISEYFTTTSPGFDISQTLAPASGS